MGHRQIYSCESRYIKKNYNRCLEIKIVQCLAMKQNLVQQFTLQKKPIKKHQLNCVQLSMLVMRPTAPE